MVTCIMSWLLMNVFYVNCCVVTCLGWIILVGELMGAVVIVIFCFGWMLVLWKFSMLRYICIDWVKLLDSSGSIGLFSACLGVLLKFMRLWIIFGVLYVWMLENFLLCTNVIVDDIVENMSGNSLVVLLGLMLVLCSVDDLVRYVGFICVCFFFDGWN